MRGAGPGDDGEHGEEEHRHQAPGDGRHRGGGQGRAPGDRGAWEDENEGKLSSVTEKMANGRKQSFVLVTVSFCLNRRTLQCIITYLGSLNQLVVGKVGLSLSYS